ncbi:MAG: hypothetical protein SPL45_02045, partial [Schwartzia succinivorans]|nr:hypothetical protein [Schwartzia succinivorans]
MKDLSLLDERNFLTVAELSDIVFDGHMCVTTINSMIKSGKIPCEKLGRKNLIDPATGFQKTRKRTKNGKIYIEKCWKREKTDRWTDSKDFLQQLKTRFVIETNRLLEREGHETRISAQKDDNQEPQIHIGPAAWDRHK